MLIHKGRKVPPLRDRYHFDTLVHGDAIEARSPFSALEMFRRWRRKDPERRRYRMVPSHVKGEANLLYFIDDFRAPEHEPEPTPDPVPLPKPAAAAPPSPLPRRRHRSDTRNHVPDGDEI